MISFECSMSCYYCWAYLFLIFYYCEQHCIEETYGWISVLLLIDWLIELILLGEIPRSRLSGSKNTGFLKLAAKLPSRNAVYILIHTRSIWLFKYSSLCWDSHLYYVDFFSYELKIKPISFYELVVSWKYFALFFFFLVAIS